MSYIAPTNLNDAFAALAEAGTAVVAGGTDFFPALGDGVRPGRVLDITRIDGFAGIQQDGDGWRIGAATSWDRIANAELPGSFNALKAAAREVGAIQIQKSGTIGGNLCNASPAADGVPPLLCVNAEVELVSPRGIRRLPLESFVKGVRETALEQGELVRAVIVPGLPERAISGFEKLGARRYLVISIAMVSALIVPDQTGRVKDARIAVGACSPVACRIPAAENALLGVRLPEMAKALQPQYFAALKPVTDVRGSAGYRADAAYRLSGKLLSRLAGERANG